MRPDVTEVVEELSQLCSLSLGRGCIVLLAYSYLLNPNQRTSRNTAYTSGDGDN